MGRVEINWFTEQLVCPYVYVDNPDQNVVFSFLGSFYLELSRYIRDRLLRFMYMEVSMSIKKKITLTVELHLSFRRGEWDNPGSWCECGFDLPPSHDKGLCLPLQ